MLGMSAALCSHDLPAWLLGQCHFMCDDMQGRAARRAALLAQLSSEQEASEAVLEALKAGKTLAEARRDAQPYATRRGLGTQHRCQGITNCRASCWEILGKGMLQTHNTRLGLRVRQRPVLAGAHADAQ
jgi:hypothetical protein